MIKSQKYCSEEERRIAEVIENALQDAGYDPSVYAFRGKFFQVSFHD